MIGSFVKIKFLATLLKGFLLLMTLLPHQYKISKFFCWPATQNVWMSLSFQNLEFINRWRRRKKQKSEALNYNFSYYFHLPGIESRPITRCVILISYPDWKINKNISKLSTVLIDYYHLYLKIKEGWQSVTGKTSYDIINWVWLAGQSTCAMTNYDPN